MTEYIYAVQFNSGDFMADESGTMWFKTSQEAHDEYTRRLEADQVPENTVAWLYTKRMEAD